MVKSVLSRPLSEAHLSRNAFDVGYTNKFTSSLGMLLPCYVRECNPDEHYRINPRMFCRSMPMNSAAFIQCTQHVEFYFVPYRLLWHSFGQWFVGTKFDVSTSHPSEHKENFPTIDLGTLFAGLVSRTVTSSFTDVLGYSLAKGSLRLLDLLGYGDLSHFHDGSLSIVNIANVKVSPFRLLAYQKICSDFYRVNNYEENRVSSYNVDAMLPMSGSSNFETFMKSYCQLRYRPWKKDLYTISNTSFQGSDFMSSTLTPVSFPSTDNPNQFTPIGQKNGGNFQGLLQSPNASGSFGLSVANLRSAFALDKLYRLSAGASDGDYKSQIKSRYGFDAYAPQYKSEFIGSSSANVQVNPITTTADTLSSDDTTGTPAGRIYGNGVASSQNDVFEFDVKEHGIIMGISSFVPDVDYSSYGINLFNQKIHREDFFQPEFDNLGKQPISSLVFNPWKLADLQSGNKSLQLVNTVLGWFPRYVEYKTSVDEVHGQLNGWVNRSFQSAPTLSLWTAPRFNSSDSKKFDNWRDNGLSLDFFYIDPSLYDSVFVNQYQGNQDQDQFICEVSNNVQAILPMSVTGEPLI